MNRKAYISILGLALVFLAFGFLTGCSSSSSTPPPPTIAITAVAADATQSTMVGTAFANPLGVNVTSNGSADSGVTVTYAATTSSGGATCTLSGTTGTTDSTGSVSSVTCTANGTAGSYTVTATATGATTPATFNLTNTAPTTSTFIFYVSGTELPNAFNNGTYPDYYAIAGAVQFDSSGNFLGGEQDYNDGDGITSPPGGDQFTVTGSGFSSSVLTTGQGTLTLVSSNTAEGVGGTEIFAVQFMNASHAIITQFDGSATSSGSMDLQSAQNGGSPSYAFTLSGTDSSYFAVAYGGVFTDSSKTITGTVDVNDDGVATPAPAPGNMTGTDSGTAGSAYGRGTASLTINGTTLSLAYYVVGPEVVRIIDVDPGGASGAGSAAVGSAYGQGCTTCSFDSTALGTADVFGILDNPWDGFYAAAGNIVPAGAATGTPNATFTGEGDTDEGGTVTSPSAVSTPNVSGNYTIATNGYGSMTGITGLGPVATLGLYATDPTLNLLDPNNTSGVVGSALVLDMTGDNLYGTGIVVPQSATTAATDLNNSYGFGAQEYTPAATLPVGNVGWEFDDVGQGTIATLALTGTGDISDPFAYWVSATAGEYSAVPFAGTATGPDAAGRYVLPLTVGPVVTGGITPTFNTIMYEAGPALVFWMNADATDLSLGTLQEQSASSLKAMHVKHAAVPKAQAKRKP